MNRIQVIRFLFRIVLKVKVKSRKDPEKDQASWITISSASFAPITSIKQCNVFPCFNRYRLALALATVEHDLNKTLLTSQKLKQVSFQAAENGTGRY